MDQVNINSPPPPPTAPPRRPSAIWVIAGFLAIVVVILIVLAVQHATSNNAATPTATPTAQAAPQTATATVGGQAVATATGGQSAATATSAAGSGPTDTPAPAASATPGPPANPTALHVTSGTCTVNAITWSWPSGARATSYELVLYDPRTGATIKNVTTSATSYQLAAGPGATVALKIRSRNAAGTGQGYFTPGSIGHVPPIATNPTAMSVAASDHTLTWSWAGSRHATAYDFVLYHYNGATVQTDIKGRTNQGQWGTKVTPGVTYYLKVRSVGQCSPSSYYTPTHGAIVGATPTPGG